MRSAATIAGMISSLALAQAATAHTPYLKPTTFAPDRAFVTVEAALSEGNFFIPDFPLRGAGDYWATGNTGAPVKAETVTPLKEFVAVEVALPADGTYRISTGERPGRSAKWAKVDGTWRMVRPAGAPAGAPPRPDGAARPAGAPPAEASRAAGPRLIDEAAVPAGAETMTAQSYLRAETYVTRGAPNRGALKPTGQGVEIEPVTHPNEVFAGDAFKFRLLNDGKPLPGVDFSIARAGDAYSEKRYAYAGKTDAAGAAAVTFAQPGAYVLETHYPGRAEGASEPIARSTVYSLTFEVTR